MLQVLEFFLCSGWHALVLDSTRALLRDADRSRGRQSGSLPKRLGEKGETDERMEGEAEEGVPFFSFNPCAW